MQAESPTGAATAHLQCTPTQTMIPIISKIQSSGVMRTQANAAARPTGAIITSLATRALETASDRVPRVLSDLGDRSTVVLIVEIEKSRRSIFQRDHSHFDEERDGWLSDRYSRGGMAMFQRCKTNARGERYEQGCWC